MFTVIRSNTLRELQARIDRLTEQRNDAIHRSRRHVDLRGQDAQAYADMEESLTRVRLARIKDAVAYEKRIATLMHAVTRYRAALTTETRRADRLQVALDTSASRQQREAEEQNRKAAAA